MIKFSATRLVSMSLKAKSFKETDAIDEMMSWGINKSYKAMESMTGTRVWWAEKRGFIIIKMGNEWLLGGNKSVLS